MKMNQAYFAALCAVLLAAPLAAQTGFPNRTYPAGRQGAGRNQQGQQCLQQAGVTRSAMQQARSIRERAKAEIEALCANTSLTRQQRQERIRQIHEQTQQQIRGIISQAQQERLQSCQRGGRGAGFGGGSVGFGGGHGGGQSPCGSFPGDHFDNENNEQGENPAEKGR